MAGDFWMEMHDSYVRHSRSHSSDVNVVFIGASIVQYWCQEGRQVWDDYYRSKGAVNYGIAGDTIQNVLWRVEHRVLEGLRPKVLVLQCGANNMEPFGPPSDEDIARGIGQLIAQIRTQLPETKIISIGLFPFNHHMFTKRAKRVNELLATNADELNVFFIDLIPHMTDSSGKQKPGLFADGLHLSSKGYDVWHQCMRPVIEKLL